MAISLKNKNTRLVYVGIGALAFLLVAAVIKARQTPRGEPVTLEKVQRRTIREVVSASGKIFPETEVKISSDVSGEVVELFVREGDSVVAGQILAKIRPDEYLSAVERGQAALNSAQAQRQISASNAESSMAQIEQLKAEKNRIVAQLEAARGIHRRNEQLYREGILSQQDYENSLSNLRALESAYAAADASLKAAEKNLASAQANIRVAEFGIASAQATLKELRTSLQKTIVVAPVSGIISKLNIEKGERVVGTLQMAGTEMMRIANLHSMEVQVEVSENDILKVSVGNEADIEVDAYLGRIFKGKVSEIANSASNISTGATGALSSLNTDQVTNFIVKVRIDPASYADLMSDGRQYPFRPGMSASVDIYTKTVENALSVPIIAVTARTDNKTTTASSDDKAGNPEEIQSKNKANNASPQKVREVVFVAVGDTVAMREVKTGIQDNDYIQIISGLKEGELVVTGPYSAIARKLKSGSRIREEKKKEKKEE
ncbi:MAG: efflux RND transporter periplasmic adaptor subunit [Saprospiraceae bacterium]|nr:efflux RND transporter periplasmic adaptor subunit [Saprospiraceae bacterium]MDW8484867.1 efflux RND transporter periplasmic adaptor subunit [Saprospiraceae bacterium]